jgi:hypothetical protein
MLNLLTHLLFESQKKLTPCIELQLAYTSIICPISSQYNSTRIIVIFMKYGRQIRPFLDELNLTTVDAGIQGDHSTHIMILDIHTHRLH